MSYKQVSFGGSCCTLLLRGATLQRLADVWQMSAGTRADVACDRLFVPQGTKTNVQLV